MTRPKKQPSFEETQAKWYKKLERSGFEDIESDQNNLKVWSSVFFARHSIEQIQAKQAYYQMATNFLGDHKFETRREKIIWEYHANGISYRDISKTLKRVNVKLSHTAVQNIVHKLQAAMYLMYKMPQTGAQ